MVQNAYVTSIKADAEIKTEELLLEGDEEQRQKGIQVSRLLDRLMNRAKTGTAVLKALMERWEGEVPRHGTHHQRAEAVIPNRGQLYPEILQLLQGFQSSTSLFYDVAVENDTGVHLPKELIFQVVTNASSMKVNNSLEGLMKVLGKQLISLEITPDDLDFEGNVADATKAAALDNFCTLCLCPNVKVQFALGGMKKKESK